MSQSVWARLLKQRQHGKGIHALKIIITAITTTITTATSSLSTQLTCCFKVAQHPKAARKQKIPHIFIHVHWLYLYIYIKLSWRCYRLQKLRKRFYTTNPQREAEDLRAILCVTLKNQTRTGKDKETKGKSRDWFWQNRQKERILSNPSGYRADPVGITSSKPEKSDAFFPLFCSSDFWWIVIIMYELALICMQQDREHLNTSSIHVCQVSKC